MDPAKTMAAGAACWHEARRQLRRDLSNLSPLDEEELLVRYSEGQRADLEQWRRGDPPRHFGEVLESVYSDPLYPVLEAVDFLVDDSAMERAQFTFESLERLGLVGARVCDIGVGCGEIFLGVLDRIPRAEICGLDVSASSIDFVRRRTAIRMRAVEPRWCQGTVTALPFPNEVFDLTIANEVIEHVEHPVRALAEISRVTRIGGFVLLATSIDYPSTIHLGEFGSVQEFEAAVVSVDLKIKSKRYAKSALLGHHFLDLFALCEHKLHLD